MHRAALPLVLFLSLSAGCANLGRNLVQGHFERQRKKAGLELKTVEAGGHRIHYAEGGRAETEAVVMVHGFTGDKSNWYAFARYLAGDHHLFALDLPPFGESPEVEGVRYTIAGHAERLAAFLDAVGVERAHLVGNSMGGHTIALFALAHPEKVASLALFDSAGVTSPKASEVHRIRQEGENPFEVRDREDLDRIMRLSFHEPPYMPRAAKNYLLELRRARAAQTLVLFDDYLQTWVALEPELPKITVPTLVLWGDKDLITDPSSVEVFAAGLPNETVVILKDCGHVPMMERPKETAGHYRDFLAAARAAD